MKIALLLNNDIHCKSALGLLSRHLSKHEVKIILSQKVGNITNLPDEIVEMQKAEKCEVTSEFSSYQNINSAEALADLQKFSPDLMISIRFGQIIKNPDLISLPRFGILNLHSGILPNYRGIMASFWAILSCEKNLGMTLHYITDAGIDTGNIIGFSHSEIDWDLSLVSNINKIYVGGCDLVVQVLEKIISGQRIETIDQKTLGRDGYFSYPKQNEVERFLQLMRLC